MMGTSGFRVRLPIQVKILPTPLVYPEGKGFGGLECNLNDLHFSIELLRRFGISDENCQQSHDTGTLKLA